MEAALTAGPAISSTRAVPGDRPDKGKLFEMIEEMEEHYVIGKTKYKKQTYTR